MHFLYMAEIFEILHNVFYYTHATKQLSLALKLKVELENLLVLI